MLTPNLKKVLKGVIGVFTLEDLFPHKWRRLALHVFGSASVVLVVVLVLVESSIHLKAILFLCLAVALVLLCLEAYFYSFFGYANNGHTVLPFELLRIIFYSDDDDLVKGLLFSDIGDEVFLRLGFGEEEISDFLKNRKEVSFESFFAQISSNMTLESYAHALFDGDALLQDKLISKGLGAKELAGALMWVINKEFRKTEGERWWSRESLSRIPGIGKNWSYGETYILDTYGEDLTENKGDLNREVSEVHRKSINQLETILARGRGSNAFIISSDESSRRDIVYAFADTINQGAAHPSLEHCRVFFLNPNLLVENAHDKISFERELSLLLVQAVKAGNIILVIPYFSAFIRSASAIGSDVISVLAPYLVLPTLHIIALDSDEEYHGFLSTKETITANFDVINAEAGFDDGMIVLLEHHAEELEKSSPILVTYPALLAIFQGVKQFFDPGQGVNKAFDTLLESVSHAFESGRRVLLKEDVSFALTQKTGIPTETPKGEEREKLQNLEKLLHERIVGQDEGVHVISEALRRSRAGVKNPDRPMGVFLFLGPTGVGKTETTKALGDIFFGGEDKITRFDMSEYKDNFAMERMIGSFGNNKAGTLSLSLKEKPYGVLLLDEFEKTTSDVINLFLRLFDEGVFSDAEGHKINAKNNIIIATSNAGSDLIWDIVKRGDNLESKKDEIIDAIIKTGVFKPELLNRFDAIVLFHPLDTESLAKIADMMMHKFAKRMREKGVLVNTSRSAIEYLVSKGSDPKFGARPMNRAIAEEVEKLIADGIINGDIKEGSQILFDVDAQGHLIATK